MSGALVTVMIDLCLVLLAVPLIWRLAEENPKRPLTVEERLIASAREEYVRGAIDLARFEWQVERILRKIDPRLISIQDALAQADEFARPIVRTRTGYAPLIQRGATGAHGSTDTLFPEPQMETLEL